MSERSIVIILVGDVAAMTRLVTAIADIGSLFHTSAVLQNEVFACLIAEMTASAGGVTDNKLLADIGFSAGEAVDTEVVGIVERTSVPGIEGTMKFHLFRDGSGIFTQELSDILKRNVLIQCLFDILAVIER